MVKKLVLAAMLVAVAGSASAFNGAFPTDKYTCDLLGGHYTTNGWCRISSGNFEDWNDDPPYPPEGYDRP